MLAAFSGEWFVSYVWISCFKYHYEFRVFYVQYVLIDDSYCFRCSNGLFSGQLGAPPGWLWSCWVWDAWDLPWVQKISWAHLVGSCPRPGISQSSNVCWFLLVGNGIWRTRTGLRYWAVIFLRPLWTELLTVCFWEK